MDLVTFFTPYLQFVCECLCMCFILCSIGYFFCFVAKKQTSQHEYHERLVTHLIIKKKRRRTCYLLTFTKIIGSNHVVLFTITFYNFFNKNMACFFGHAILISCLHPHYTHTSNELLKVPWMLGCYAL